MPKARISAPIQHVENLLTAAEVCAILRVSRKTLYNYTHTHKGRPPILPAISLRGAIRFRPQSIEEFVRLREAEVH
jgi:predicted DNA-binding transcriptional regulator AlpA